MTTVDLDSISSYMLLNAGDAIIAFQTSPTQTNWNNMNASIKSALSSYTGPGSSNIPNVGITLTDGTIAYYTNSGTSNTYANFTKGGVPPGNFNNRPAAMTALLSNSGVGYGTYVSMTVAGYPTVSTKWTRTGFNSTTPLGLLLIAYTL